jgi:hypothetical protein
MAGRRCLLAIIGLAAILHGISIARTLLPAQDGLKFIRIARQFRTQPWVDVVRGSDQHPLYPALIAAVEPVVAWFSADGGGPQSWRIAAQMVAAIASLGVLVSLYRITIALFDARIACLAIAIQALLPFPFEVGSDTLSDSLGLWGTLLSLELAIRALRTGDIRVAIGSGLAAGIGYLARPEVILVPLATIATAMLSRFAPLCRERANRPALVAAAVSIAAMLPVAAYATVKGGLSEKLAVRMATGLGQVKQAADSRSQPGSETDAHSADSQSRQGQGLDDPRWDFSAKEESDHVAIAGWGEALRRIVGQWWEELCWFFAVMTAWGLVRQDFIRSLCPTRQPEDKAELPRRLLGVFSLIVVLVLIRHSTLLGYLSGRHTLILVALSCPWAAAGTFVCARGIAVKRGWSPGFSRRAGVATACVVAMTLVGFQQRLTHPSRWGHWAAGRWLAAHLDPAEAVLDTRGWATFVSGCSGYDYWHVRQALSDSRLSYIVVGIDELEASSDRAKTLNAVLKLAGEPVEDFPAFHGLSEAAVRIYRFHRPSSWEGLVP